jgi:hypothetical protein
MSDKLTLEEIERMLMDSDFEVATDSEPEEFDRISVTDVEISDSELDITDASALNVVNDPSTSTLSPIANVQTDWGPNYR